VSSRQGELRRLRQALLGAGKPDAVKLFDDLVRATAQLAALSRTAPDPDDPGKLTHQVERASAEVERLETALAESSAAFREQRQQAQRSPEEVRAALPAGTVLIDLLDYWDFDPRRHNETDGDWEHDDGNQRRIIAFVSRPDRPQVEAIDLGPTWASAMAVNDWRKTYGRPWADGRDPATDLRRLLLDRLRPAWQGADIVLISPDGILNRLPWGALPGKDRGRYLIEEVALAIIPIPARLPDLLTSENTDPTQPSLLLVGDVQFDGLPGLPGKAAIAHTAPHLTRGGAPLQWAELSGTRAEVEAIRKSFLERFSEAQVAELRRADATEAAVRREAPSHRYLHFATHGYFAPAQVRSALAEISRPDTQDAPSIFGRKDVAGFHPGLLSGLVLAGANRPVDFDYDDGILTALEVEALDLSGVGLATLSACETGLGESAPTEGPLGLQRAFQTAGAQSVVAGLWQVGDRPTQLLMQRFYDNLWRRKMTRLEALREAQLWMLREVPRQSDLLRGLSEVDPGEPLRAESDRLPPFYWAAFVLSGDWR
jgi:CHAT domain-containing protein